TALAAETKARLAEKRVRDQAWDALRAVSGEIVESQMARDAELAEENKEFLRKIIKHYEGFAALTADDVESRTIRAEGYCRVAMMRDNLGEIKEAEKAFADALALRKQLAGEFPDRVEFRYDLARTYNAFGTLLRKAGPAAGRGLGLCRRGGPFEAAGQGLPLSARVP